MLKKLWLRTQWKPWLLGCSWDVWSLCREKQQGIVMDVRCRWQDTLAIGDTGHTE